jgi:hypothetical protein
VVPCDMAQFAATKQQLHGVLLRRPVQQDGQIITDGVGTICWHGDAGRPLLASNQLRLACRRDDASIHHSTELSIDLCGVGQASDRPAR